MPTPHQAPQFHDTYRSPVQTSPTTSVSEMNSYYHQTLNQLQGNIIFVLCLLHKRHYCTSKARQTS